MEKADEMELKDMFESGLSVKQMSEMTTWGQETIYKALRRQGVDFAKKGIFEKLEDNEVDDIVKDYQNPELRMSHILLKYGLTYNQLYKIVDGRGVVRRTAREDVVASKIAMMDHAVQLYLDKISIYDITEATGIGAAILYLSLIHI